MLACYTSGLATEAPAGRSRLHDLRQEDLRQEAIHLSTLREGLRPETQPPFVTGNELFQAYAM